MTEQQLALLKFELFNSNKDLSKFKYVAMDSDGHWYLYAYRPYYKKYKDDLLGYYGEWGTLIDEWESLIFDELFIFKSQDLESIEPTNTLFKIEDLL